MKAFLFGFSPSLEAAPLLPTERALQLVGDNTGNLAFCYAISQHLGGDLRSILWHAEPPAVERLGDVGVLTLANQLGSHVDLGYLVDSFRRLDVRLVGIGLGAQAGHAEENVDIPQGTLDWIRAIQDHSPSESPNLAMRGEFSRRSLERYGLADKAVVTGCPTLFINPDPGLGRKIVDRWNGKPELIAVTAGHQRWTHLSRLEASLVQMACSTGGDYICQSPLEMVRVGRGEAGSLDHEVADACRQYAAPWMSDVEFSRWTQRHARSFFSAAFWMDHLRRFDFVVGTRIHGVMLALQVGVPAMCVAHDSRTLELCATMKVPHVEAKDVSRGITRDMLSRLFQFDADAFDKNRLTLAARYVRFLRSNGLEPATWLASIAQPAKD
ncbi:polysaccharide pyruvyl transferase family protein [Aquabacterium sp. J223]|uniref:polysaccharide pyruvyl transferase family protein n=1 Tax=Aquabacterium sp. J223 TaxID=2898431 RepID=UPI0021AE0690|nr:polysaccharide pyruvyl transferase family protein [Aquabacterium sp. J223]UUX94128.1 polysaccharide pyruvyl transferase family protein [Aquabacterium sp. J223]